MVRQLITSEAAELLNEIQHMPEDFLARFRQAFQDECRNKEKYVALEERTYYLIYNGCRAEALFGINFNEDLVPHISYNISSFARIIKKDSYAAPGWRYLDELIIESLSGRARSEGVRFITARLKSEGGKRAFLDLQEFKIRSPGQYKIAYVESNSGRIDIL
jgi:hypothetical protein